MVDVLVFFNWDLLIKKNIINAIHCLYLGFDTTFQNTSQPSVQTNILSADNPQDSYMLDYSRSQFVTGIVPSYNGVSDYYTPDDENARYKFEKI
jgi:hypothetical protein